MFIYIYIIYNIYIYIKFGSNEGIEKIFEML